MRPTCVKCGIIMAVVKNEVWLVELSDGRPYRIRGADMSECSGCGAKVLSGYSTGWVEWHEPEFAGLYQRLAAQGWLVHASEGESRYNHDPQTEIPEEVRAAREVVFA
jgi:hypothetical protein